MTIKGTWIEVSCDSCGAVIEYELDTDPHKSSRWAPNTDRLYEHLERMGWTWTGGGLNHDICLTCSSPPSKEDIADYKAYHAGEGIHTP